MKYNPYENVYVHDAILPQSTSATALTQAYFDAAGYSECLVIAHFGTAAANAEADLTVEESDSTTEASFASITGASFRQVTVSNDNALYVGRLDLSKRKRYIRPQNVGDGSNAAILSCCIVGFGKQTRPVTQANTVAFNL